jgi:transcriptional regulator with XRE-family HTH domain
VVRADQLSTVFGQILREQRTALGLSQEALALDAGIDRTFVSQLERGIRQPTLMTVWKVADVLGIAPSELIRKMERALRGSNPRR